MASRRPLVIGGVAAAVVLVVAGAVSAHAYSTAHRPHLDAAARRAVPAIESYLTTRAAGTWDGPVAKRNPGRAGWFCRADPVESRQAGGRLRVGVLAQCGEYLRRGGRLVIDAGYASPLVVAMVPQGSGYAPVHVAHPWDGTRFAWSVRQMFTADGARTALRRSTDGDFPEPAPAARRRFGLPAGAPIVQG